MAPKKDAVPEKVLLGRPGNNLKSGIVCEQNIFLSISFLSISSFLSEIYYRKNFSRLA